MAKKTKIAITIEEKTATTMKTAATASTAIMIETAAVVTDALKIFRKGVIIALKEKIAIVMVRTFKMHGAASFNIKKKYI